MGSSPKHGKGFGSIKSTLYDGLKNKSKFRIAMRRQKKPKFQRNRRWPIKKSRIKPLQISYIPLE